MSSQPVFSQPEEAGFLPIAQLSSLVAKLMAVGYQCLGPTVENGAIVMRELDAPDALPRGLANGVLFGVNGAHAVFGDLPVFMDKLLHLVADVIAVREARGGTHKTGDENPPVSDNNTTALSSIACRPLGDSIGDFEEVVVP